MSMLGLCMVLFGLLLQRTFSGLSSILRSAGPHAVLKDTRITPVYDVVPKRSLLLCYAACLESLDICGSFSYDKTSGSCNLIENAAGNIVTPEARWVSVFVVASQKVTTTEGLTTETSTEIQTAGKTTEFLQTSTTLTLTTPNSTPFVCPSGFTKYGSGDKCYQVLNASQAAVANAVSACNALSAELLSIETADEQEFIKSLLSGYGNNFWTSGRGNGGSGFVWASTSSLMVYDNFASGVPNGSYGTDECVFLQGPWTYKRRLDSCSGGVNRYICEYPKTS